LRRFYWACGFALVGVGLLFPWFDPVTTPRFNALNFPFAQPAYLWPRHFVFISYGSAALVIAALAFAAWWTERGVAVFCAGALLLLGGMTFFLQVTSWEPTWLKAALDGGQDFQHCYHAEMVSTLPNAVVFSPARGLLAPVEALADRFSAGTSAVGAGWIIFMFGALWICAAGAYQTKDFARLRFVLPAFAFFGLLLGALQVWRPIVAERYLASSRISETRGAFADAEKDVRRAMAIDEWQRVRPPSFVQLGILYKKMGLPDRPETFFSHAVDLEARGLVPEALFEYTRAANGGDPGLRRVALIEKGRLASHYASTLYKKGVPGEACRYWLVSIEANPQAINGSFGAARAFHDMAEYWIAIKYFEQIFTKTSQPCLIADIANDLGDCWYKLGHSDKARNYYMASRKWHDRVNYRALKTLTESDYK
jgi:tetratricopeptide (TPR) repeat protein